MNSSVVEWLNKGLMSASSRNQRHKRAVLEGPRTSCPGPMTLSSRVVTEGLGMVMPTRVPFAFARRCLLSSVSCSGGV